MPAVPGVERGTVGTGDSHSFNLPVTFRHAYWLLPESEIGLWGRSLPCPISFLHPAGLRIELVGQESSCPTGFPEVERGTVPRSNLPLYSAASLYPRIFMLQYLTIFSLLFWLLFGDVNTWRSAWTAVYCDMKTMYFKKYRQINFVNAVGRTAPERKRGNKNVQ